MTKEELKQEAEECMHNALFWLKLPISKENVEQGGSHILKLLEPREKRIAELIALINAERERQEKCDDIHLRTIAELEKENAELKEEMRAKQVVLNDFKSRVETVTDRYNKKSSQLTKAKEVLQLFLKLKTTPCASGNSINMLQFENACKQAEQFLNSEVEK